MFLRAPVFEEENAAPDCVAEIHRLPADGNSATGKSPQNARLVRVCPHSRTALLVRVDLQMDCIMSDFIPLFMSFPRPRGGYRVGRRCRQRASKLCLGQTFSPNSCLRRQVDPRRHSDNFGQHDSRSPIKVSKWCRKIPARSLVPILRTLCARVYSDSTPIQHCYLARLPDDDEAGRSLCYSCDHDYRKQWLRSHSCTSWRTKTNFRPSSRTSELRLRSEVYAFIVLLDALHHVSARH
ncbi:hypothetical protein BD413DRAFT_231505 [Trametes elegans]|nr:hypothetical protein BD413DRAFT_231505 [Trametes elegans]